MVTQTQPKSELRSKRCQAMKISLSGIWCDSVYNILGGYLTHFSFLSSSAGQNGSNQS